MPFIPSPPAPSPPKWIPESAGYQRRDGGFSLVRRSGDLTVEVRSFDAHWGYEIWSRTTLLRGRRSPRWSAPDACGFADAALEELLALARAPIKPADDEPDDSEVAALVAELKAGGVAMLRRDAPPPPPPEAPPCP